MKTKTNLSGDIKLSKEDRIEILNYVNLLSRSLDKASEIFDLELSDLRDLDLLKWKLYHKLNLTHNEDQETKWLQPFILRENNVEERRIKT
tara:strand:- start:314 stop:586 length:273 start_codon:yes stop_codon:yes gene_type:complete